MFCTSCRRKQARDPEIGANEALGARMRSSCGSDELVSALGAPPGGPVE